MKKIFAILLAMVMLVALAACGSSNTGNATTQTITRGDVSEEDTSEEDADEANEEEPEEEEEGTSNDETANENDAEEESAFSFLSDGLTLTPGDSFDSALLPDSESIYEVPSCAIDGTDKVYTYASFELTAYDDGSGEVIYSIYITDPNVTTPEGLALGDSLTVLLSLYGEDYVEEGSSLVYTRGTTQLCIIMQDEFVISIEYLLKLT